MPWMRESWPFEKSLQENKTEGQQMVIATRETADSEDGDDDELELFTVYTAQGKKDGIFVSMEISGKPVKMQVDTGASVSLIPESLCHSAVFIYGRYHTCAGEGPGAGEVWGTRVEVGTCGG